MNARVTALPFEAVVEDVSAGNNKVQKSDYLPTGSHPVVDQGQEFVGGFSNDKRNLVGGDGPWIVFGDHTRVFKYVDFPFCMGADGVKVLRPRSDRMIDTKYLFHFLRSEEIPSAGYSRHYKFLKRLEIPIPPLNEQRRIAAILDKADALRRKRKRALELFDGLIKSIFLEEFGDPIINPRSWPRKPVGDICKVVTGNTPPRSQPDYYGSTIEWIKSDNIDATELFVTGAAEYLSEKGKAVARVVPAGSTLVTCIAGSPNSIGSASMTDREVAFNQQINALVPIQLDPLFLAFQIKIGKRLIQEASTGGMKGLVSKSRLEKVLLMCPPMRLQERFSVLAGRFASLKGDCQQHIARTGALFSSLQSRAFSGQL